jgi:hypothetical protein
MLRFVEELAAAEWSGDCDRLSGQRGVDIVHTLYTGGWVDLHFGPSLDFSVDTSSCVRTFCVTGCAGMSADFVSSDWSAAPGGPFVSLSAPHPSLMAPVNALRRRF